MSDKKDALSAFSKFTDLLEKKTKGHVKLKGFSDIDEFIPTGNYMLNALMSGSIFGGYPNTRSVGIAGEPGTGKTFLCMNAIREAQKMGYVAFYIDTEGALDSSDFEKFGVDLGLLKYVRLGIVSEVKFFINDLIKTIEENPGLKLLIVVDSLGMLETDKEVSDLDKGKSANDMGLRAKELRSLFKSFTLDLSNLKVPFLFTNHISSSLDQYTPDGMGGGKGPQYSASIVLFLKKAPLRDEATNAKTGVICRITTDKNRLAKPDAIETHISFVKGMNKFTGLHKIPFNFDNCGIGRGNKFTEKEFSKLKADDQAKCRKFEVNGETLYFLPKETARSYISMHTGEAYPLRELFTDAVWTESALKQLDENVIKPMYKYSTMQDILNNEEIEDFNQFDDDADSSL